jgi:hypothetical protein
VSPTPHTVVVADERYQQPIAMLHELHGKGVTLADHPWLYEIKNLSHVTRDTVFEVPLADQNGDRPAGHINGCMPTHLTRSSR